MNREKTWNIKPKKNLKVNRIKINLIYSLSSFQRLSDFGRSVSKFESKKEKSVRWDELK